MIKFLFSVISKSVSTNRLLRHLQAPVFISPMYHTVSDSYLPHIHPLYSPKGIKQFEADIEYLCRYFKPIHMDEVLHYTLHPDQLKENVFHITFDDGLREVYTHIMPILYRKNIPATVFVNTSFIDNQDLFYRYKAALLIDRLQQILPPAEFAIQKAEILSLKYRDQEKIDLMVKEYDISIEQYLKEKKPYLSTKELKELQEKGFTIGSHTMDHPLLQEMSEEEALSQIKESSRIITRLFNERHNYFAFPFTDENVSDSLLDKIYQNNIDLTFGISDIHTRKDKPHWGRIDMENYGSSPKEIVNKTLLKRLIW